MGRRPLAEGESGTIKAKLHAPSGQFIARCRVRDGDGVRRQVQAQGKTAASATKNLKEALKHRGVRNGTRHIHSHMRFCELADIVFADLDNRVALKSMSVSTVRRYKQAWNVHISPAMGQLALHEVTTMKCDDLLMTVRIETSPSNTKVVRATFNKVISYAAKGQGSALPLGNPMRDTERIPGQRRRRGDIDTLSPNEVRILMEKLRHDPAASEREIDYMVLWMVCTGDRIGNMLAADWSYLNLIDGTAYLQGVAVEHNGRMQVDFDSSKGNDRNIDLPSQLVTALQALWLKRGCPRSGFVFPGKRGNPRGLRHLHEVMADVFDRAGYPWLRSHGFRRTTATELMMAGVSDHEIAAYLGHDDVDTTRRHYLRKRNRSEMRREALDDIVRWDDPQGVVTPLHARDEARMAQSDG